MFGSQMLEVAIGLGFVYLLLSLTCSAFTELIANVMALRAHDLETGIQRLLDDAGDSKRTAALYKHPLIKALVQGWPANKPNYIPSHTFTLALFDTLIPADPTKGAKSFREVRATISTLPKGDLRTTLLLYIDEAHGDLKAARENVEAWFDDSMDRVSDWYRRQAQIIILVFSLLLCAALNVDTLTLANTFYRDPTLRTAVVAAAEQSLQEPVVTEGDTPLTQAVALRNELTVLELPLGWAAPDLNTADPREMPITPQGWIQKLVGVLLTAFAVSLGAPFWFDMLKKLVGMRAADKAKDEAEATPIAPIVVTTAPLASIAPPTTPAEQ